ncbi:reverse transcriptase [Gossypium australe]|uniref:Reverse transcriptase n=1 Tax=Gossypium australe TaxID=47621 RepID=A0A5B6UUH6_9ROSI|nr:reverse transcriptase [Gossypium australe]
MCIPKTKGGLGFKEFSKFNLALLAKQGWKIITQPNCLFACVMKAKYFSKRRIHECRLSIWGARQLLEEGIGWRIGNGNAVNIWNDAWLPGLGNGRVQGQNIDIRYSKVLDLIDKETTTWKQDTIQALFGEEQLESILLIPLARSEPKDVLIWRGDNTWVYIVKSGYNG